MQNYLDQYLNKYVEILNNFNPEENAISLVGEKQLIDAVESYYQKFVAGKYNLSRDEFSLVYSIKGKKAFYNEVKTKFKMNKRNAEKLFNSIKKDFETPLLFN